MQSGVLQSGFLQSGVYISVSHMTALCSDIDIDPCSLHSGVQINVSYTTGLCPDTDIDCCFLHSAHGAAVWKSTNRQETTMARHGTMPEMIYLRQLQISEDRVELA